MLIPWVLGEEWQSRFKEAFRQDGLVRCALHCLRHDSAENEQSRNCGQTLGMEFDKGAKAVCVVSGFQHDAKVFGEDTVMKSSSDKEDRTKTIKLRDTT